MANLLVGIMKTILGLLSVLVLIACATGQRDGWRSSYQSISPDSFQFKPDPRFDTPPVFLSGRALLVPWAHVEPGEDAQVLVGFTINKQGEVENPVAYNATNSYVMGNALYAVKRWRFKPAMKDGKPVAIEVFAPFKVLMK
jgi:TonB family protein